jgi:anti-sigma factor RsiW
MRDVKTTAELLAAYVDGVTELSVDERRRVEAALAGDSALRAEEAATRDVLGQLRELSPVGGEPDWAALEREIAGAVGPDVPRPWWRRWRWVVPGAVLATTAAVAVLVLRPGGTSEPVVPPIPQTMVAPTPAPDEEDTTMAFYLDGAEIEVELEAAEADLLDDSLDGVSADDPAVADGFLSPADLAWVDELDDEALERIEGYLAHSRKKG